jgi:hypothetical protein
MIMEMMMIMIMEITIIAGVGSCVKRRIRWVGHVAQNGR